MEEIARELAASNRALVLFGLNVVIFAAITEDMVLKPFWSTDDQWPLAPVSS